MRASLEKAKCLLAEAKRQTLFRRWGGDEPPGSVDKESTDIATENPIDIEQVEEKESNTSPILTKFILYVAAGDI